MAPYETKLKLGRKLDGVDTSTASANQVSALFRFDENGEDEHVSISIESDAMGVDDVVAVFQLLHDRGVLTAGRSKTWLNQPKASKEQFGETTTWGGVDLEERLRLLRRGLKVRTAGAGPGAGSGTNGPGSARATGAPDAAALAKTALVQVGEVERRLAELKRTLRDGPDTGAAEAEPAAAGSVDA